jgi:DNA polymerase III psi subunit
MELAIYVNLLFTNLYTDVGEFEFVREGVLKKKNEDQFGFNFNLDNINDFVNEVGQELKEALLLSSQLIPVLAVGLNGNPRQTKRFLNTMLLRQTMAKSKGEELNKRILAKLMLLEYFKSETFKAYYKQQAQNTGIIPDMAILEEIAKSNELTDKKINQLTIEQQAYLNDSWIKSWLASEPSLVGIDLQSYFYFSRDKLSVSGINLQRMSSLAQEVLRKIMSDSETIRNVGLKETQSLSAGDASAIFESLCEKIKYEDKQVGENPTLKKLFDFCESRKELISQLLGYIEKLPHQILPIGATTWLQSLTDNTEHNLVAERILQEWSKSDRNKPLAKIAKNKLKTK